MVRRLFPIGLALCSCFGLAACLGTGTASQDLGAEACNGLDDDNDGNVDLDGLGAPLFRDCSNACGEGFEECVAGAWAYCSAPQAATEECNAIDDDCDGEVDEGCGCEHGRTRNCATGDRGSCLDGVEVCDAGSWSQCSSEGLPSPWTRGEICDGYDNDCDGRVDEGLDCHCDSVDYNGHTYLFCVDHRTWSEARDFCEGLGSTLVSIESEPENSFVGREAFARVPTVWWIGLSDSESEGDHRWGGTGASPLFTSWADAEPNDASGNEDCVTTDYGSVGGWNDDGCWKAWPFVCER